MTLRQRIQRVLLAVAAAVLVVVVAFAAWFYEPDPGDDAPRVLVSVDRTLWNRSGLIRWTYIRALRKAGVRPVLIDFENRPPSVDAEDWLQGFDGLVISGGGDVGAVHYGGDERISRDVNPARDDLELELLALADARAWPVLGICRGAQLMNVYHGGTLGDFREDTARYNRHHRVFGGHAVQVEPGSRLAGIYTTTELDSVVTWHGQYVDRAGDDVSVVAWALDGTPEAIEVATESGFGMLGVQWHAEVLPWDDQQQRLFNAFADAVNQSRAARSRQ